MSVLEFELTSVYNQSLSRGSKVSNENPETEEGSRTLRRMMGNWGARKVADVGYTERTTGQHKGPFLSHHSDPVQQDASPHSWLSSGEAIKNRWWKLSFNKGRSHPFLLLSSISTSNQMQVFTCKSKPQGKFTFTWSLTPTLIQGSGGGGRWIPSGEEQRT